MCIVTQTVQRIARELHTDATRLEHAAINSTTEIPTCENPAEALRLLLIDVRAVAARLRRQAELLDGKD